MPRRRHGGSSTRRRFNNRRRTGGYRRTRKIFRRSNVRRRVGHRRVVTRRRHNKRFRSRSRSKTVLPIPNPRPSLWSEVVGNQVVVAASSATVKACLYTCPDINTGWVQGIDTYYMHKVAFMLANKRNQLGVQTNTTTGVSGLLTTLLNDAKVYIANQRVLYTLINQNNANCECTVYKCRVRQDLPHTATNSDPLTVMAQGFAVAGIDSTNFASNTNLGMVNDAYTPFFSTQFVQKFHIVKVLKSTLLPGVPKKYLLTKKKRMLISPLRYGQFIAETTTDNITRILAFMKGAVFYVFKFSGSLGASASTAGGGLFLPGYTTPQIMYEVKQSLEFGMVTFNASNVTTADNTGFGSGTTSVREPFDMDYKVSTNV